MFSSESWLSNQQAGFYNNVATQSLRFDDGSSAYLSKTLGTADNKKKWVWSGWIKRSELGGSVVRIFNANDAGSPFKQTSLRWDSDQLRFFNDVDSNADIKTTAVFRDVSAWYHILIAIDTTQTTDSNRIKIYVNGSVVTDLATSTYPNVDTEMYINEARSHTIGASVSASQFFDGYMAEVNFIDGLSFFSDTSGTANTSFNINSFGETKNGVWIAKEYEGSYGTNGFRLQFNQTGTGTASASTIGADTSGNTNHWTSSGIVASDCNMPDSPENNFATLNPLDTRSSFALSEGNTKLVAQTNQGLSRSTFGMSTGKWYFELTYTNISGDGQIGIANEDASVTEHVGNSANSWSYKSNGLKKNNNTTSSYGASYTTGDVIGVTFDADNGNLVFYKNNASQGDAYTGLASSTYFPAFGDNSTVSASTMIANFGQDSSFAGNKTAQGNTDGNGIGDFYYAPPSGFLALCTSNLPEPTISPNANTQADDYFNTVTYTGTGSSNAITGVGFQPDWTWIKRRSGDPSAIGNGHNSLYDSTRGVTKEMYSDLTSAEATNTNSLTAFGTDGFTVGSEARVNANSETHVAWNWKANGGTTSSNTDGSITSTVQANTDAGFSIVTYTGTGASATVGHGLGADVAMLIIKKRSSGGTARNWSVWHQALGGDNLLSLNTTSATASNSIYWGGGNHTTSVFEVNTSTTNNENTYDFVAYCFAEVEGFSRFGSYTGNSSTDGTFVYTGFRPAFIIYKKTSGTGNWGMLDNTRSTSNLTQAWVASNLANAETNESTRALDFLSNGFKARGTNADLNTNSATYIYMAFAENPFKYANAR